MSVFSDRLFLRAFEYSDLAFLNKIRNDDFLFEYTCGNKYYISSERDRKWIEDKMLNNRDQLYLMVCLTETSQPIGYICAVDIDYVNRKAVWAGLLLSRESAGKGYGTEAGLLLLEHLFCELGMNMVYGYVRVDHKTSVRMIEKVGFRFEGKIRSFGYKRNRFFDVHVINMLKSEFDLILEKAGSSQ